MALKQQKLDNAKIKLVEQEYQSNLKERLEDELYNLINKLNHIDDSLSTIELHLDSNGIYREGDTNEN